MKMAMLMMMVVVLMLLMMIMEFRVVISIGQKAEVSCCTPTFKETYEWCLHIVSLHMVPMNCQTHLCLVDR